MEKPATRRCRHRLLSIAAVDCRLSGGSDGRPQAVQRQAQKILDATANNFGWLYLMTTSGFVLFALGLAFSRFGSIRLGPDDEPPEFSFKSWLAMIFSGGMGVGLVFWG